MITPLSNQSYNYQYAPGQIAQPTNKALVSRPQTEGSLSPVGAIESKRIQDLGPKECKT